MIKMIKKEILFLIGRKSGHPNQRCVCSFASENKKKIGKNSRNLEDKNPAEINKVLRTMTKKYLSGHNCN